MNASDRAVHAALRGRIGTAGSARGLSAPVDIGPDLTLEERLTVVATMQRMLEGVYTHLPQKRAMYGQDPVQRLRQLEQLIRSSTADTAMTNAEFHRRMAEIVTDLRDSHTRYIVGARDALLVDALPVLVEYFAEPSGKDGYVVSKTVPLDDAEAERFRKAGFLPGVRLTHWNAVPIARAIDLHAAHETGGRPDARRARALESLTLRPRYFALPPDAEWIIISFETLENRAAELRLDWLTVKTDTLPAFDPDRPADFARAINPAAESARRVKKMLFATRAWYEEELMTGERQTSVQARAGESPGRTRAVPAPPARRFARNVDARLHTFDGVDYGHLRIWSFDLVDDEGFVDEIRSLLATLPSSGLVIDLRANPGGLIWAAERLLQLFTPADIEPTRFSMLASDVTRAMAAAPHNAWRLEPWRRSLEASVGNGDPYSGAVPMTMPERCNDIGQVYAGPVLCVVDANTYSAGDLFTAGFIDNRVGPVVAVDRGTGAGGANVWSERELLAALSGTDVSLPELPGNVTYTVAIRRATRVGAVEGMGIEDVGVGGHFERALTRRDLVGGNADLLDFCCRLLADTPRTDMSARLDERTLLVTTSGIDRVDVYERERPLTSCFVGDGDGSLEIVLHEVPSELDVIGFSGAIRRQRRRLRP